MRPMASSQALRLEKALFQSLYAERLHEPFGGEIGRLDTEAPMSGLH